MTSEEKREHSRARRADLTARGYCLNGEQHGKATHGRCCAWCRSVHNVGLAKTRELATEGKVRWPVVARDPHGNPYPNPIPVTIEQAAKPTL